jgi:ribosome-associated protein
VVHIADLLSEIQFTASRSGGPGGQHVNKVSSKVTLRFDVLNSTLLSEEQRQQVMHSLASKLTKEGILQLVSQGSRSQSQNKEQALQKFDALLAKAFTVRKKRKKTKPTKAATRKRITNKKKTSEKKQWRQKV